MRKISEQIHTFYDGKSNLTVTDTETVCQREGFLVNDYADLIDRIAALAFNNPQFLLFFRGQKTDYKSGYATTILPAIFRNLKNDLKNRYDSLKEAEEKLVQYYSFDGTKGIRTHGILRWAILQHYQIESTPLLDVTYSPRVACTFSEIHKSQEPTYVYVLGLPQISGSISVSSEHEIQNIRLISVCPPVARRPHYQEGHLIADYPTLGYVEKMEYDLPEVDFNRRLICKFRLNPEGNFQTISEEFLFPDSDHDRVNKMAQEIINARRKYHILHK